MDFTQIDIHSFLKASLPHRFQDINPYDFEKFIAHLFRNDGYEVLETEYAGDYGADLLLTKDKTITAVQVKRYAPGAPVGVSDVNQVIGACSYYKAHNALVITTSDFTSASIRLAKKAEVVLWNWPRLEKYISKIFLDGQDYHNFFGDELLVEKDDTDLRDLFEVKLLEVIGNEKTVDETDTLEMHLALTNTSDQNLTIHLDMPIIVSKKTRRQVRAVLWKENYFFHGVIVSGATIELACSFLKVQIDRILPGDRLIMHIHVAGNDMPMTIDQKLRNPSRGCYIVTYCYGRNTPEYAEMIAYRDEVLMKNIAGRFLVSLYYRYCPVLISVLSGESKVAKGFRYFIRTILQGLLLVISKKNRTRMTRMTLIYANQSFQ